MGLGRPGKGTTLPSPAPSKHSCIASPEKVWSREENEDADLQKSFSMGLGGQGARGWGLGGWGLGCRGLGAGGLGAGCWGARSQGLGARSVARRGQVSGCQAGAPGSQEG